MLRLRNLLVAAACLAGSAHGAAADGLGFVLNSADASISVIDVATRHELRRIPVLREPHHMALTPDGKSLLVGDTAGNALFFLDPHTGEVQKQMPMADPYQLQFSPDGKWLAVTGLARNQIDLYDGASLALVHRVPEPGGMPSHINFSPDAKTVYVSLQETNRLVAIDLASGSTVWSSEVGKTPAGVLWHDGRLLVGIMGQDFVAVVNPADGRVEKKIVTGRGAHNLFVSPDGRILYVCNRVDGSISTLDARSLAVTGSFKLAGGPDDIDFAPDGTLWVTRRFAHSLAFLDPRTGQSQSIPVGRSPHGIWLDTHLPTPARVSMR